MIDYSKIPPSRQPEGSYPYMLQQPPQPIYPGNRPISPRENYRMVLRGETPYWLPASLADTQYCWPDVYQEHALWEGDGYDWFGQHWTAVPEAGGQMPTPGFRVISDITKWKEEVKWPDLSKVNWDEDAAHQTSRYDPERCHLFHCVEGCFERLHELMPMDETMIAFYEEPELVKEFFERMVEYKIELLKIIFEKYDPIDYIIYGDDWGTQRAGFFSNEMFREFIMPCTKKIIDFVHSTGRFVELHSCGLTQQYIEELVELGIDAWMPQPINDLDWLTQNYADRIAFTLDIPGLKACKTEDEVRTCIRQFVDEYAPRGRIVSTRINMKDEALQKAALEELYYYSSEFYAKKRAAEGK